MSPLPLPSSLPGCRHAGVEQWAETGVGNHVNLGVFDAKELLLPKECKKNLCTHPLDSAHPSLLPRLASTSQPSSKP